ncbi:LKH1 [Candida pseudojiufengensis]|uniref:LKH1 n=1 Tax=Candida pseudojiufengensis TaxID=497109 RepID=UPI00222403AB|nr:LKH1 [Candida pseudojiufengensis]KAI5962400.1 LKH1 [Candida pseudojiufengensis]
MSLLTNRKRPRGYSENFVNSDQNVMNVTYQQQLQHQHNHHQQLQQQHQQVQQQVQQQLQQQQQHQQSNPQQLQYQQQPQQFNHVLNQPQSLQQQQQQLNYNSFNNNSNQFTNQYDTTINDSSSLSSSFYETNLNNNYLQPKKSKFNNPFLSVEENDAIIDDNEDDINTFILDDNEEEENTHESKNLELEEEDDDYDEDDIIIIDEKNIIPKSKRNNSDSILINRDAQLAYNLFNVNNQQQQPQLQQIQLPLNSPQQQYYQNQEEFEIDGGNKLTTKKQRTSSLPQLPQVKCFYNKLPNNYILQTPKLGNIKTNVIPYQLNLPPCDDENGHYIIKLNDTFANRFIIIKLLGQGTFGKVVQCYDKVNRENVAIKIIRNIQKYRDAAKIELRILSTLKKFDNQNKNHCIHLRECFDYRGHICIVTDLLKISLYDFLENNKFISFPGSHIQAIAKQLIRSVTFLHDLNLIHTDLKPENILLHDDSFIKKQIHSSTITSAYMKLGNNNNSKKEPKYSKVLKNPLIQIIDFGSAVFNDEYHSSIVSTRHYRAPEIVLGTGWSYPCDMWSIGCILVELIIGEPLFKTHDNLEHLAMIEKIAGYKIDKEMIKLSKLKENECGLEFFTNEYIVKKKKHHHHRGHHKKYFSGNGGRNKKMRRRRLSINKSPTNKSSLSSSTTTSTTATRTSSTTTSEDIEEILENHHHHNHNQQINRGPTNHLYEDSEYSDESDEDEEEDLEDSDASEEDDDNSDNSDDDDDVIFDDAKTLENSLTLKFPTSQTPEKFKISVSELSRIDLFISKKIGLFINFNYSLNYNFERNKNKIEFGNFTFWWFFIDLMKKLFIINPRDRITALDALNHPWFNLGIKDEGTI